jgi:hypothetical protein
MLAVFSRGRETYISLRTRTSSRTHRRKKARWPARILDLELRRSLSVLGYVNALGNEMSIHVCLAFPSARACARVCPCVGASVLRVCLCVFAWVRVFVCLSLSVRVCVYLCVSVCLCGSV